MTPPPILRSLPDFDPRSGLRAALLLLAALALAKLLRARWVGEKAEWVIVFLVIVFLLALS